MDNVSDTTNPTVRDHYDPEDDSSPSDRVVRSVAVITDTDPVELPPLYETIDPDALDVLVEESAEDQCEISFRYAESAVYFSGNGDLHVGIIDE